MDKKNQRKRKAVDHIEKQSNVLAWITGAGVLLTLCVLPVVYDDFYFNLLETKYKFYYISMLVMIVVVLALAIYNCIFGNIEKIITKNWWRGLNITDWAMVGFVLVSAMSTLFSEYRFESIWGNEGRFNGLFLTLIYGGVYVCVTRYFRLKAGYLDAFLAVAAFVCLFGITDYFKMDMLGFKENVAEDQIALFTSTLGNINTYTSYVGMVLGVVTALFATSTKKLKTGFYYIVMIIGFFAIVMGTSDNAYLALGALFAFLPCFVFGSKRGVRRYVMAVTAFFTVIQCMDWINTAIPDAVIGIEGVFNIIAQHRYLIYIVAALWGITAVLYALNYVSKTKDDKIGNWLRYLWCSILLAVAVTVVYVLYDANVAGNADRYAALSNYLVFNDEWGSYRGVAWRLGLEEYMKFPFHQKLIGYGPDTFGILLVENRKGEMTNIAARIYDSAHNEYIQYLITLGALGLLSYLTLVSSAIVRMVKRVDKYPYILGLIFAVACYMAQAIVNINLPITTPIFMMFLMMGMAKKEE